jgi:acylphosphatase
MNEQFGVITIKNDRGILVVYEGNEKELFDMLDIIKKNISETAEVKFVDKNEYEACKENIIELNNLLA